MKKIWCPSLMPIIADQCQIKDTWSGIGWEELISIDWHWEVCWINAWILKDIDRHWSRETCYFDLYIFFSQSSVRGSSIVIHLYPGGASGGIFKPVNMLNMVTPTVTPLSPHWLHLAHQDIKCITILLGGCELPGTWTAFCWRQTQMLHKRKPQIWASGHSRAIWFSSL